ncbi:MAG: CDP-diacylglycerol---glycerol-3-phosphate 3-phosphatidyltransferase [Thermosediminibacterales bacterium]|nr:CDP-diacylglycerol---glycerol-3-phosphate 3-phosphatidyltransferase [Thermosediminibacterales bacterium]
MNLNLANKLTLIRIFLVPVFLFFLLTKVKYGIYIATGIFILAASTDGLDGYIARSRNQITKLGKFIDPLADKLLITAALVSLVEMGRLSTWVAMIIIGREFAITGLRVIAASEGIVISASKLGKIKTLTQIIAIVSILVNDYPLSLMRLHIPFGEIFMGFAVFFTVLSGIDYLYRGRELIKTGTE